MTKLLSKITISALLSMAGLIWVQASSATDQGLPVNTWNPPLETPIHLVNHYRQPNSDYSAGHRGIDYLVKIGQPVFAPSDGQIWFSGKVGQRNLISMSHSQGYLSEVEPVCTDLAKGEQVFQGQQVGIVCETAPDYLQHCASATCLHFSLRKEGSYLSPLIFIGDLNPSRLLATPN